MSHAWPTEDSTLPHIDGASSQVTGINVRLANLEAMAALAYSDRATINSTVAVSEGRMRMDWMGLAGRTVPSSDVPQVLWGE